MHAACLRSGSTRGLAPRTAMLFFFSVTRLQPRSTLFPTRRSSDLAVFLVGLSDGTLPTTYAKTPEQLEEERRLLYVGVTRARDRKSTRLNSSHQIISYAVFCLKKKKKRIVRSRTFSSGSSERDVPT